MTQAEIDDIMRCLEGSPMGSDPDSMDLLDRLESALQKLVTD